MSLYRSTAEQWECYPPGPEQSLRYPYHNILPSQHQVPQPSWDSRAPQPAPYHVSSTSMHPSSTSRSPQQFGDIPQQYGTGYHIPERQYFDQYHAQLAAGPQYLANGPPINNTDYHNPQSVIPNHALPAYERLYNPDEDSSNQKEPLTVEQVQDAEVFVDRETLGWIPPAKLDRRQMRRLERPVVIPRIGVSSPLKAPLPFLRAYSPVLVAQDIHEKDFLAFIDNLGVAQAGSPVFTAMNAAGQGVGFVPWHWAAVTGASIQIAAGVGSSAMSIIRTKRFLAKANEQYFGPRGLKVSLKKDDDLVNCLFSAPSSAQAVEYKKRLLAPADMKASPMDLRRRKMAALEPYIAPLTERVLPQEKQGNILDRMAAKGLEKTTKKEEKRLAKTQRKAEDRQAKLERLRARGTPGDDWYDPRKVACDDGSSISSDSSDSDSEVERMNRRMDKMRLDPKMSDKKRAKYEAKIEGDRAKCQKKYEKKLARTNRRVDKENEKAEKKVGRMEYIVVENI